MQVTLWLLLGFAFLVDNVVRGYLLYLTRLSRRGVSGTEIMAVALAPVLLAVLVLRLAGIAAAFVLADAHHGTTSAVLYGLGGLWLAVTIGEFVHDLL